MFKDSNELSKFVLNELQLAVNQNKPNVCIILSDTDGNIQEVCDRLEVRSIIKMLRDKFNDYEIKSKISKLLIGSLTVKDLTRYQVVWWFTLQKK